MTLDDIARIGAEHTSWDQSHRAPDHARLVAERNRRLAAIDDFANRQPVGGTLTPTGLRDLLLRWEMERPA